MVHELLPLNVVSSSASISACDQGKQGCCVAGKAIAFLDITFAMHKCKRFQLHQIK